MNLNRSAKTIPLPEAVLLLSSVFWGLSWYPLKYFEQQGLPGALLIALCYGLMGLVTLPKIIAKKFYIHSHWPALIAIFFAGGLANLCFNYALIYGDVVRVMVLFYLLPMWGVLGAKFFLQEPTSAWRWLGVVLSVIGAFILLGGWALFDTPPRVMDVVAVLAGVFFAANNLLFRGVEDVPIQLKLGTLFWGAASFAGMLFFYQFDGEGRYPMSPTLFLYVMAFALVWLMGTNIATQWAVTKMPAGRSSILMVTELVAAVVSAILVTQQLLTWNEAVGGLLILVATGMEIQSAKLKPQTTVAEAPANIL